MSALLVLQRQLRELIDTLSDQTRIGALVLSSREMTVKEVMTAAGMATAFTTFCVLSVLFTRHAGSAATLWPANAFLCAMFYFAAQSHTRALTAMLCVIGGMLANHVFGDSISVSTGLGIINVVESYLTYRLLSRFGLRLSQLTDPQFLFEGLFIAAIVTPALSAMAGATVLATGSNAPFLPVFTSWFFASALGNLIVLPTLLIGLDESKARAFLNRPVESLALMALLSVIGWTIFADQAYVLLFLPLPIVVLISLRFGEAGAAWATLILAVVAIIATTTQHSAAAGNAHDLSASLQLVQLFLIAVFVCSLPTAAMLNNMRDLRDQLTSELEQRRRLEYQSAEKGRQLDIALNNMSQGLCMYDADHRMVLCNDHYAIIYGLKPTDIWPGMTLKQVVERRIASGIYGEGSPEQYRLVSLESSDANVEKMQLLSDGRSIAISKRPLQGGGWVTTHKDITATRRVEARMLYLAHNDALTSLPNRTLLADRVDRAMTRARRGDTVALLVVGLDDFKIINDTMGHAIGDDILKTVAERLRSTTRETDTAARLGGDEFAILAVGSDGSEDFVAIAERLKDVLAKPFIVNGKPVVVAASIGIALAPNDAMTSSELLRCADLALYQAKADDRGGFCFFEQQMDVEMRNRRELEQDLRLAVDAGQLKVYYQPLVDLETDTVCGMEALVRWQHPERGLVSPADFIPIAESTGLIVDIGSFVLRQACVDAAGWRPAVKIAVNLSALEFQNPNLVDGIRAALDDADLDASRLQIEVTESVVMQRTERSQKTLLAIQSLGVEVCMDDFGTGYSSLSSLRMFRFDKLKIDRSFVKDLPESEEARAILSTIVDLARTLGMRTTAEGVETLEQKLAVRLHGCGEYQGYLFSKPKPASDFRELIGLPEPMVAEVVIAA